MTFPKFVASAEFRSLPADIREQVLREVLRRFDAGEINRDTFIPGYKR